jgi:MYXO-CTERM domain-containing protein
MSGAGPTRGHEDITRFGVEMANAAIDGDAGPKKFYPEVTSGDACAITTNELLAGNCATDWPTDEMTTYYGVSANTFGDDPGLQDLHGLRNFDDASDPVSGRYACHLVRARILNSTQRGLQFWQDADKAAAMRWIGHATHTVQDSFTPCHTTRSGTRFETLDDICTYAATFPGICTHYKPDTRDAVWRLTPLECTFTTTRSWDCLVDQAQAASKATAGYLVTVARLIDTSNFSGAQAAIETWFEGDPTVEESGYFRCDALKADGVEPDGWSPPGGDAGAQDAAVEADAAADGAAVDAAQAEAASEAGQDAAQDGAGADVGPVEAAAEGGKDAAAEAAAEGGKDAAAEAAADAKASEPTPADADAPSDGGCGCRTSGRAPTGAAWLAALAGVVALRSRRRRTSHGH